MSDENQQVVNEKLEVDIYKQEIDKYKNETLELKRQLEAQKQSLDTQQKQFYLERAWASDTEYEPIVDTKYLIDQIDLSKVNIKNGEVEDFESIRDNLIKERPKLFSSKVNGAKHNVTPLGALTGFSTGTPGSENAVKSNSPSQHSTSPLHALRDEHYSRDAQRQASLNKLFGNGGF